MLIHNERKTTNKIKEQASKTNKKRQTKNTLKFITAYRFIPT